MKCRCGYSFSEKAREDPRPFNSWALVHDKDYVPFIRSEIEVFKARGEKRWLEAIGLSSEYVGCVLECPQCFALAVLKPGGCTKEYYTKENETL